SSKHLWLQHRWSSESTLAMSIWFANSVRRGRLQRYYNVSAGLDIRSGGSPRDASFPLRAMSWLSRQHYWTQYDVVSSIRSQFLRSHWIFWPSRSLLPSLPGNGLRIGSSTWCAGRIPFESSSAPSSMKSYGCSQKVSRQGEAGVEHIFIGMQ